jgi:membrane associated rhomboid family serine protease
MKVTNNLKQWKTTALGLVLILASIASVFIKSVSWSDAMFGIGVGLVLIFSPDSILAKFDKFIKNQP